MKHSSKRPGVISNTWGVFDLPHWTRWRWFQSLWILSEIEQILHVGFTWPDHSNVGYFITYLFWVYRVLTPALAFTKQKNINNRCWCTVPPITEETLTDATKKVSQFTKETLDNFRPFLGVVAHSAMIVTVHKLLCLFQGGDACIHSLLIGCRSTTPPEKFTFFST